MNRLRPWLLSVVLFLGAVTAFAASPLDVVGRLDAYDGTVAVVRGGAPLSPSQVDTGFVFENNDQIKVGSDGWADVALDTKTGIRAHLHLKSSTNLLLDLSSLAAHSQTGALDLLAGSISLKVEKMVGGNRLDVHTETAAMGVRGTEFAVDTEVDGSVLLTTSEGKVELSPDQGASHFSVPGTAVRGDGEESTRWTDAPVTDPQAFTEAWHQERQKDFLARRELILARLADRYQNLAERFDQADRRLAENQSLWEAWAQEESLGKRVGRLADARLRMRIQADLGATRRLAWSLERVHQRLTQIEARMGAETFASLNVQTSKGNWTGFVQGWHAGRGDLERRLAVTHFRVKLFALRHGPLVRTLGRQK